MSQKELIALIYKKLTLLFAIILVIALILALLINHLFIEQKKRQIHRSVMHVLADYPSLPPNFTFTACYYKISAESYLLLQHNGHFITGKQDSSGEIEYYHDEHMLNVYSINTLASITAQVDDIRALIGDNISELIGDTSVSLQYATPNSSALPLWVYPKDSEYLIIDRQGYEQYMETMVYKEDESLTHIRWSIARSPEDVLLYLLASDNIVECKDIILPGWGKIPEDIIALVCS